MKTSIKSVTQKVSTVERGVTTLKQKYTQIEVHTQGINNLFDEIKEACKCKENDTEIMKMKRENIGVKAKLSEMETDIRKFKNERETMKELLLDLQCRSMKYNLLFTALKETPYENTEEKLRGFLGQGLGIEHWI